MRRLDAPEWICRAMTARETHYAARRVQYGATRASKSFLNNFITIGRLYSVVPRRSHTSKRMTGSTEGGSVNINALLGFHRQLQSRLGRSAALEHRTFGNQWE
jgi:hypothetical protein